MGPDSCTDIDQNLCTRGWGEVLTQGSLVTHDDWIVVYPLCWWVCRRTAVVIFRSFDFIYYRLVRDAFTKLYCAYNNFHMSTNRANRVGVVVNRSSSNEYFQARIISSQKDILVNSTSELLA